MEGNPGAKSHSMEFTTSAEGRPWRKAVNQVRRCYITFFLSINNYVLRASGRPVFSGPTRLLATSTLNGSYLAAINVPMPFRSLRRACPSAASGRQCEALGQLQLGTSNLHFLSHRLRVYLHNAISPIRRFANSSHLLFQTHGLQLGYSATRWPKRRPATK